MARWMFIVVCFAAASGAVLWACTQPDGGRCQIHSDCESGHWCCKDPNNPALDHTSDGICMASEAACLEHYRADAGSDARTDARDADGDGGGEGETDAEPDAEEEAAEGGDEEADVPVDVEDEAVDGPPDAVSEI